MKSAEYVEQIRLYLKPSTTVTDCFGDAIGLSHNLGCLEKQRQWFQALSPFEKECIECYKYPGDKVVNLFMRGATEHELLAYFKDVAADIRLVRVLMNCIQPQTIDPYFSYVEDTPPPVESSRYETAFWLLQETIYEAAKGYAKKLYWLICAAPRIEAPLMVCRDALWREENIPRQYETKAFVSTAYSTPLMSRSNLHILLPKGCPALFIDVLTGYFFNEFEILLPPGLVMYLLEKGSGWVTLVNIPRGLKERYATIKFLKETFEVRRRLTPSTMRTLHKDMIEAMLLTGKWPDLRLERKSPIKNMINRAKARTRFRKRDNRLVFDDSMNIFSYIKHKLTGHAYV